MADNVQHPVTGTGTADVIQRTDDLGASGHVPYVKLMDGTDNGTGVIPGDATNGLDVDVTRLPALPAGTNNIGDVDVLTLPAATPVTGSGSLTALNQEVALTLAGRGNATFQLTGTWTATITFEASNDNTNWTSILAMRAGDNTIASTVVNSTNNDIYRCTVAGFVYVRARCSAYTSGTIVVTALASEAVSGSFLNFPLPPGTNNIGDVDVLTVPAPLSTTGNGTAATALRVTVASDSTGVVGLAAGTNTNEVVGDVAHSIAAAGNPLGIGGISQDTDDTAPPNRVDAEGDATRLATDRDGALFVRTHSPQVWSYHLNTSTAQTDASVHAAPGAGLSLYVGTIVFSVGAATAINMFLEEGASTVIGPFYLEAVNGRGMAVTFNPPRKITANTALTITTSASVAHSVDITGFTAQG